MPALLSPQPVHARFAPAAPGMLTIHTSPRPCMPSPVRPLKSPISLVQRRPPSQSTCTPPRRRTKATPRRRRAPIPRVDRPSLHVFDQLPWISALESAPELTNPWDIADLSLIPDPSGDSPPSAAGPVRRRKTSLRSNPMGSAPSSPESPPPSRSPSCEIQPPPLLDLPLPVTPLSRFSSSQIFFRNLMPVYSHEDGSASPQHHCINIPRPLDF